MDIKTLFDKAAYQMVTDKLSDKYTEKDLEDMSKSLANLDKTFDKAVKKSKK